MDDLSRKFRSIDWKGLQKSVRKVQASTASALKDMVMTDLENKTRAATADTSWGASGTDLMAIAHGTYRREDYALIMSIVWQRLASSRWRCVYKALELLKFLIMHGAARCAEEARSATPHIQALTHYAATDEQGRDVGEGVRRRATLVCKMLSNEHVLEEERAQSRELRAKLQGGTDSYGGRSSGLSSDDYRPSPFHPTTSSYGTSAASAAPASEPTISTTTTAKFKGYGDDDDDDPYIPDQDVELHGHYDEQPTGQFAQRAKASATVDDLLGDDDPPAQPTTNENAPAADTLLEDILGGDSVPVSNSQALAPVVFTGFADVGDRTTAPSKALAPIDDFLSSETVEKPPQSLNQVSNGQGHMASNTFGTDADDDIDDDDFDPRASTITKPSVGSKVSNTNNSGPDSSLDWL